MDQNRILIVDDEPVNLKLIGEILKGMSNLSFAKNGAEALSFVDSLQPDLVLLDIMMPDMDGFTVAKKIRAKYNNQIPIIFVSALNEGMDELQGFEVGAVDYITKPLQPQLVQARVSTQLKLAQLTKQLRLQNKDLDTKVEERTTELRESQKEIILRLGRAAEYRDPETGNHLKRMSHYTSILGKHHGLDEEHCELLQNAATLHDIGKLGTPDAVLLKEGKLSDEEMNVMKHHTILGEEILAGSNYNILLIAQKICIAHHEKWDGTGYPNGLKNNDIPVEARLAAVADVFDALCSNRPYKKAWTNEEAISWIHSESGKSFDPDIVLLFESALPEIQEVQKKYSD